MSADALRQGLLDDAQAQLVDISLATLPITPLGDLFPDRVAVAGTTEADAFTLAGTRLTGLPWTVNRSHAESIDTRAINGGAGKDTLAAPPQPALGVTFSD